MRIIDPLYRLRAFRIASQAAGIQTFFGWALSNGYTIIFVRHERQTLSSKTKAVLHMRTFRIKRRST